MKRLLQHRVFVSMLVLLGSIAGGRALGQQSDAEMLSILADMTSQKHRFRPDRLHAMGVKGLSALLDELLPDTAQGKRGAPSQETIERLIHQLGSRRFRTRREAGEQLYRMGPGIRETLLKATRNDDAEIAWQASQILRKWQQRRQADKGRYVQAFSIYASGIDDDRRLEELTRRTIAAMGKASPEDSRDRILTQCITTIAAAGKDQYTDRLEPLLEHEEVRVAVMVARTVAGTADNENFPALLSRVLRDDRPEVVGSAIGYMRNCKEHPRREEIKELLIDIFNGKQEGLKFQTTLTLAEGFDHEPAREYLFRQVKEGDRERRYRSLSFLGNVRRRGTPADERLLTVVKPLLKSDDKNVRRMAARALGVYSGEVIVKSLLPLLADPYATIPKETKQSLLRQSDRDMVRRLVSDAAENHEDDQVREAAAAFLEEIGLEE